MENNTNIMNNKIIIAVDAMGGENSPKKIVDGIELSLKKVRKIFSNFMVIKIN